jgi:hypothetical protein
LQSFDSGVDVVWLEEVETEGEEEDGRGFSALVVRGNGVGEYPTDVFNMFEDRVAFLSFID